MSENLDDLDRLIDEQKGTSRYPPSKKCALHQVSTRPLSRQKNTSKRKHGNMPTLRKPKENSE